MHAADFFQIFTRVYVRASRLTLHVMRHTSRVTHGFRYVCKLPPTAWSSLAIRGEWTLTSAGGSCRCTALRTPPASWFRHLTAFVQRANVALQPAVPHVEQGAGAARSCTARARSHQRRLQGEAVVSLSQTDFRGHASGGRQSPPHTCIGLTIWKCKAGAAPQRVWSSGAVVGCVRAPNTTTDLWYLMAVRAGACAWGQQLGGACPGRGGALQRGAGSQRDGKAAVRGLCVK